MTGWEDQVLSGVNLSWGALDALAEDLVGCSGPDALGERISYSCVLYILGMREKTSFPVPHAQKEHETILLSVSHVSLDQQLTSPRSCPRGKTFHPDQFAWVAIKQMTWRQAAIHYSPHLACNKMCRIPCLLINKLYIIHESMCLHHKEASHCLLSAGLSCPGMMDRHWDDGEGYC